MLEIYRTRPDWIIRAIVKKDPSRIVKVKPE
jgi:hypothetical protein